MPVRKLLVGGGVSVLLLASLAALAYATIAFSNDPRLRSLKTRLAYALGLSDMAFCFQVSPESQAFDTLTLDTLRSWNRSVRYVVNPQHLSVDSGPAESMALRQQFVPSDLGSERVIAAVNVSPRDTYELKQRVYFEDGFDWGQEAQSGKFGFALAGGSAPSGGKLDKDGFSARFVWLGNGDGTANIALYLYSADRTQNLPYGDEILIPNFTIPTNEWLTLSMRLTVNTGHENSDGSIAVEINDGIILEKTGIQWQSEGSEPTIDLLLYSSFHGGNSPAWSPVDTVHARFSDACLFD